MEALTLETTWQGIKIPAHNYNYNRIDSTCIPELNIGLNAVGNRCLILGPIKNNPGFAGEKKENITTFYNSTYNLIILELTDNYYHSLFLDLVISLYFKIKDIKEEKESTLIFISTINMWSSFLEDEINNKHSEDMIKGLFGELSLLNELLKTADNSNVNYFLKTWKGPYDTNHDFYFDDKNIEVKTKNNSKSDVNISSEFQLEEESGKSLELVIVSLETQLSNGLTIEFIVNQIRDKVIALNGDLSILYEALKMKAITHRILNEYNNYQYSLISHQYYNCIENGFPRLIKSELPENINGVKYKLNLKDLDNYITKTVIF
jgi:hypothetical protein